MQSKIIILLVSLIFTGCVAQETEITPIKIDDESITNRIDDYLQEGRVAVLRFSDIDVDYDEAGSPVLADDLLALDNSEVYMQGYIAPPLELENEFFVLTRIPVFVCPFCSSPETWTGDFVVVYADEWLYENKQPVEVRGILELGAAVDEETGLVSLVRIQAHSVTRLD